MAYQIISAAGTTILSATPATLRHILATGTVFGKVSIYDSPDGTSAYVTSGSPIWVNTFTANDMITGKNIGLRATRGLVAVTAAAGAVVFDISNNDKRFPQ